MYGIQVVKIFVDAFLLLIYVLYSVAHKAEAKLEICDMDGLTPLHVAARWGHAEVCRILVK